MFRYTTRSVIAAVLASALATGCSTPPKQKPELSHKEHAALLLQVANGALIEGDATGALGILLQAEQEDPDMPEIHHSKALAYYAKNDLEQSLREARITVKLAPEYPDANNTLGKILVDLGKYSEASMYLMKAAMNLLYRDAYKAWTNLGILYYRESNLEKASEYFEKAIDANRAQACIAYYYRGHLKLRQADYTDAIRDYRQATLRNCGGFADAHLAIGITYERSKQYALARKSFLEVQQQFPNTKASDEAMQHMRALP